ncbi:hypothetical protein KIH74_27850 [Kineosporia sp. J2-2]|uniref:Surface-anchored protein n=1 Tax=Kineosporia corallincola TaxID=2835133 RepID=A0ABS5TNX0_9ACTN|nr:hypothetical protein [Kineosporia corallincola]MBT0772791.1 hypothetical protein [Kineosporia corallincola]
MKKSHIGRTTALMAAAGALLAASFVTSGTAQAADAECAATGITPSVISRGVKADIETVVTLKTDCPAGSQVEWHGSIAWPEGVTRIETNPYSMFTTFQGDSPKFNHSDEGKVYMPAFSPKNDLAGIPMPVSISGFVDADGDDKLTDEPTFGWSGTITQLRQTRVGIFSTPTTTVTKGASIKFSAAAERANWDTRTWDTFRGAGFLDLQFSSDGGKTWSKVSTHGFDDSTFATATETGDYRAHFKGDLHSGASASTPVHVTVS